MGLNPDKYRVIRNPYSDEEGERPEVLEHDEVFVLRRGDVLATSALRSYVSNILTMLDTDRALRTSGRSDGILDEHEREWLRELADDVTDLAERWELDSSRKLPD